MAFRKTVTSASSTGATVVIPDPPGTGGAAGPSSIVLTSITGYGFTTTTGNVTIDVVENGVTQRLWAASNTSGQSVFLPFNILLPGQSRWNPSLSVNLTNTGAGACGVTVEYDYI
jgi:hypothetical protein